MLVDSHLPSAANFHIFFNKSWFIFISNFVKIESYRDISPCLDCSPHFKHWVSALHIVPLISSISSTIIECMTLLWGW